MDQRRLEQHRKNAPADQPRRLRDWSREEIEAYDWAEGDNDRHTRLYRGTMLEWAADEIDRLRAESERRREDLRLIKAGRVYHYQGMTVAGWAVNVGHPTGAPVVFDDIEEALDVAREGE